MSDWLGVDVGWFYPAADSDGRLYEWTKRAVPTSFTAAGPVTVRRVDGSVQVRAPHEPDGLMKAISIGTPTAVVRVASSVVAAARGSRRGLALEDWAHFHRRKEAWVKVWRAIVSGADRWEVPVAQVNRAYTSITCPECGLKTRANRPTRNHFACVRCGHSGQSDIIAAVNIAAKAAGLFHFEEPACRVPGCEAEKSYRAGMCGPCYRFTRRMGHQPTMLDLELRKEIPDQLKLMRYRQRQALLERRERRDAVTDARLRESYATHDAWGNPLANPTAVT